MIKAAIVGLGRWGQHLVDSVQGKNDVIRFVRGVSRNPDVTREFGSKCGLALTNNFQEVLNDPDVDAVMLATPHSLHFREIVAVAKAGQHVFVEKPMTLTSQDAVDAVCACDQEGVAPHTQSNRSLLDSLCFLGNGNSRPENLGLLCHASWVTLHSETSRPRAAPQNAGLLFVVRKSPVAQECVVAHAVTCEPVSRWKFPANREKNREFFDLDPNCDPELAIFSMIQRI